MRFTQSICIILIICIQIIASEYGTILASANLEYVFPEMIKKFYKKYPDASIHVQYGASGSLAKDIENGNNYDLFLSANMGYPQAVYKNGAAIKEAKVYAKGKLILFLPKGILKDRVENRGLKILEESYIKHIVIANKEETPYGKATIDALKNSNMYSKLKNKIVYTSDTGLVIDSVLWRNNVGFLPKSALHMLPKGHITKGEDWIEIDKKLYNPIIQGYVVSKSGIKNKNAMLFLNFLTSKSGKQIFRKYGYDTP